MQTLPNNENTDYIPAMILFTTADCTVGDLKTELTEDERHDATGTYIVLDGVDCNGTLLSWQSCFFLDTSMTNDSVNVTEFDFVVGIFRLANGIYVFQRESRSRFISPAEDDDDVYKCLNVTASNNFQVLEGDVIGLRTPSGRCNTSNGCRPGLPILNNASNGSSVFYHEDISSRRFQVTDVSNPTNHISVSINIRAYIVPGRSQYRQGFIYMQSKNNLCSV